MLVSTARAAHFCLEHFGITFVQTRPRRRPAGAANDWLCKVSVAGGVQNAREAGKSVATTTGRRATSAVW